VAIVARGIKSRERAAFTADVCSFAQYLTTMIDTISGADHRSGVCLSRTFNQSVIWLDLTETEAVLKTISRYLSEEGVVV
jgi:hypothetical protein